MQTDTTPRFERERIARKGFLTRNRKLIALGQIEEHRSVRYGDAGKLV